MQAGAAGEALRGDGLNDVALDNVLLELRHEGLVTVASNVGSICLVGSGIGLERGRERRLGLVNHIECRADLVTSRVVCRLEVAGGVLGESDVGDDGEGGGEVVEGNNGIVEHEEGLGDVQVVLEVATLDRPGFEVLDAIVRDVAHSAAGKPRKSEGRDAEDLVLGELPLKGSHGIADIFVTGAGREDLSGIGSDKAVTADGLGAASSALEEERVFSCRTS